MMSSLCAVGGVSGTHMVMREGFPVKACSGMDWMLLLWKPLNRKQDCHYFSSLTSNLSFYRKNTLIKIWRSLRSDQSGVVAPNTTSAKMLFHFIWRVFNIRPPASPSLPSEIPVIRLDGQQCYWSRLRLSARSDALQNLSGRVGILETLPVQSHHTRTGLSAASGLKAQRVWTHSSLRRPRERTAVGNATRPL